MKKILFTGGGSAGHVLPNIALIEELLSTQNVEIAYVGSAGIEKEILQKYPIPYFEIPCTKLIRGKSFKIIKQNLGIPYRLYQSVKQAKKVLLSFRPDIVFSKGGYVALPVVMACRRLKIPCYAHESDYSIGLANRISARFCKKIFTTFPETAKKLKRGVYSGPILRRQVLETTKTDIRQKFGIPKDKPVILVFGGGSGSKKINEAVRKRLLSLTEKYFILHICGKGNVIENHLKNYLQFEFVKDMGSFYAVADMVIARGGSGTVFEVLALKKPAIFIPLEGETRGDQLENATYFQRLGLCHMLQEKHLDRLETEIQLLANNSQIRKNLLAKNIQAGNGILLKTLMER